MLKKKFLRTVLAVIDIVLGAGAALFITLGPFFLPGVTAQPFLSTPFLIGLALPGFLILTGVAGLLNASYAAVLTLFACFLGIVNALAALFSPAPPLFLQENAPPALHVVFHYALPATALLFFCAHALLTWLGRTRDASDEPAAAAPNALPQEFYCASCQARLKYSDEVCPSCGELIRGQRCNDCGHEGKESEFADGRCPHCGKTTE